jgi:hypothetical protein
MMTPAFTIKMDLGRFFLPSTVERGGFVSTPGLPTSITSDSWIPLPPTAAPAAGGCRIHGSRLVYSVGYWPATSWRQWSYLCGVWCRRVSPPTTALYGASSSRARLPRAWKVYGSGKLVVPCTNLDRRRIWCLKMKMKVISRCFA